MLTPAAKVELGIGAGGALVDVSSRLHYFETARGRTDELSAIDTATARVRLENSDRALEPEYAGSPYYPNVEPDAPLVISATWSGTSYPLFTGVIGDLAVTRRSSSGAFVEIPAVDAFERINAATFTSSRPIEYTGARIAAILDAIGDPGARALDVGQSQLGAQDYAAANGLSAVQEAALAELGVFYIAADGTRTFQDRHRRLKAPYDAPRYVFADAPAAGEVPYTIATPAMLKQEIVNSWTISDPAGDDGTAEDAADVAFRGRRSKSRTANLALVDELAMQARYLLAIYGKPALRFRELATHGDALTFEAMLALELGDRVRVRQQPAGGGAPLEKDGHVERISITHERGIRWSASLRLSLASLGSFAPIGAWTIGSSAIAY